MGGSLPEAVGKSAFIYSDLTYLRRAGEEASRSVEAGTWMGLLFGQRAQSDTMTRNAGWCHGLGGWAPRTFLRPFQQGKLREHAKPVVTWQETEKHLSSGVR